MTILLPQFKSLRVRFLFAALLWVSIATAVAGAVISYLYRSHLTGQFHNELDIHLVELIRLSETDEMGNPTLDRPLSDPRFQMEDSGFYWQIERAGYQTLKSTTLGARSLDGSFAKGIQEKMDWADGPYGEVLMCGISAPSRTGGPALNFTIAVERRILGEAIAGFNRDLTISLTVFALLMLAGATLQTTYGLRPAQRIADDIERLRRGDVPRLSSDAPAEFSGIVTRLNALLDNQSALVQRARVEAGNLAHGLRTPLALISDEAEQLARKGDDTAATFIQAQCRKISRQVNYHMMRARAAGTRMTSFAANLHAAVQNIVGAMQRLHASRNLSFVVDISTGLTVNCDEGDLSEILSNLIDNACKWARTNIRIAARHGDGGIVIEVTDDGPGIADDMRDKVFDVGARLDEGKAGSGLGLAIARDLARLYGGDLELEKAFSGGLLARLRLPDVSAA
ncbi:MAG: HAMP domain-containing histidine kinase [Proteobacteria bacterium]|nr:HAMP domain-containing histidine kinase [Pseudomonadota bacterium]